jgi:type IV pilus assembly protein PilF
MAARTLLPLASHGNREVPPPSFTKVIEITKITRLARRRSVSVRGKTGPVKGMILGVSLLLAAGLLLPVSCASNKSRSDARGESDRYLRLAYVQLDRRQTKEAMTSAQQAIARDPENPEAHYFLGLIYMSQSDFKAASEHLKEAVRVNPYYTDAHNSLGVVYREMKQYDKALQEFQTAMKDRNYATPEKVQLNLGNLYQEQNIMSEAVRCYERAIEINPKYVLGYLGLGSAYQKTGKADLAAAQFRKVMSLAPDSPEAAQAKQMLETASMRGKP